MKCLLIINPTSGRQNMTSQLEKIAGKLILNKLVRQFEIYYTQGANDAFEYTQKLKKKQYDFIIVVGGDGTVNEVIGGLIESQADIPLAIMPAGTVNDFATYLKLPKSTDAFVSMIENYELQEVDIGRISNQYFANVVAGGAFSDVSLRVSKPKKARLGSLAYYLEGILSIPELFKTELDLSIRADDKTFHEKALIFLISNTKSVGGFKQIASQADVSDGVFDILVIRKCEITDMIALSKDILLNKHIDSPFLNYFQASHIEIDALQKDLPLDIDGEKGPNLPIVIDNIPKALKIIVPRKKK